MRPRAEHACASLEWTNCLTRQEVCVCLPCFVRERSCVRCTDDFFCDGSHDSQEQCLPNSLACVATNVSGECLCNVTFEVVHSNNVTKLHSCQACSSNFFKRTVGNTPCLVCTPPFPQFRDTRLSPRFLNSGSGILTLVMLVETLVET